MVPSLLFECDAEDADAHVHGGVAVVALTASSGRVVISMRIETLEKLALRIQMELANARGTQVAASRQAERPPAKAAPAE